MIENGLLEKFENDIVRVLGGNQAQIKSNLQRQRFYCVGRPNSQTPNTNPELSDTEKQAGAVSNTHTESEFGIYWLEDRLRVQIRASREVHIRKWLLYNCNWCKD